MTLLLLARVLRVLTFAPAPSSASRASAHPQLPYRQSSLHLAPRTRPHTINPERRAHRTAMRLALDGLVVVAGVGQVHSVGILVLATTRGAAS
ncbi:hypothetical protein ACIA74_14490 [Streptomyces sp. NPDC051658]|uniref:hypothetical protein n=1 Tax=Streptomyces sp. NPDC051658 TaxID=3365667 RepID=UPI003793FDFB